MPERNKNMRTFTTKSKIAGLTAAEKYQQNRKHIATLMGWLEDELEAHEARAKEDPKNWGYAGDLGSAKEGLMNILSQLTGFETRDIETELEQLDQ